MTLLPHEPSGESIEVTKLNSSEDYVPNSCKEAITIHVDHDNDYHHHMSAKKAHMLSVIDG